MGRERLSLPSDAAMDMASTLSEAGPLSLSRRRSERGCHRGSRSLIPARRTLLWICHSR